MRTPAASAAARIAATSCRRTSVGVPASTMKLQTSANGMAPLTARSFTVPFTASSPIDPPANLSGLTTKLSVVIARHSPPSDTLAASPSSTPVVPDMSAGTINPSTRRRLALPPAPCAMSICASAKTVRRRTTVDISAGRGGLASMHVVEVRGAGPFRRHHQRPDGLLGRTLAREQLALVRLQDALQHLAALRGLRVSHLNGRDAEAGLGVPSCVV